jgi:riboflavin kinase/FMN adenylyltransferase
MTERKMPERAIAIGVFDGVHVGHKALLKTLIGNARARNLHPTAVTFDPPPALYFNPHFNFMLTSHSEKEELLKAAGIEEVVFLHFAEVANASPQEFIDNELCKREARLVIVGKDFHFGKDRQGSEKTLLEAGKRLGFSVESCSMKKVEGEVVSATRIRELLLLGHLERANALLGYEYFMDVVPQKGLGRAGSMLETPTLNFSARDVHKLLPPDGVYAVRFGKYLKHGICYVGTSPTFGDDVHRIEVHILEDFTKDEEEESRVAFVSRLRPDMKFNSVDTLKKQIRQDKEQARRMLSRS